MAAGLALAVPAPTVAQGLLDIRRIDSLMAVAADRIQSAALAAAREDAGPVQQALIDLFGYGGVFVDVLSELAKADCSYRASSWVQSMTQPLFALDQLVSLAWDRSDDGTITELWPQGPEHVLDRFEDVQEAWVEIKDESREYCQEVRALGGSPVLNPPPTPGPSPGADSITVDDVQAEFVNVFVFRTGPSDGSVQSTGDLDLQAWAHTGNCPPLVVDRYDGDLFQDRQDRSDNVDLLSFGHVSNMALDHVTYSDDDASGLNFAFALESDQCYVMLAQGYDSSIRGAFSVQWTGAFDIWHNVYSRDGGWNQWHQH